MKRHSSVCIPAMLALLLSAGGALAQTTAQEGCINTVNKAGAKVASTQGKENSACVKAAGSGNLAQPTTDACLTADMKAKVSGAQQKTLDGETSKCESPYPAFGYTSGANANAAAKDEEIALFLNIFGNPAHPAMLTDKAGAGCQAAVAKSYEKLASTRLKAFNSCKKDGLKTNTVSSAASLGNCVASDTKLKVAGAKTKLTETVAGKCATDVTLATAFPGCSSEAGSTNTLATCIIRETECAMCTMLNEMDGLSVGCDAFDDGSVNQTCRQCGNGLAEAPEACDTAGNSATCDSDCTAPSCGDGLFNAAFGEACDVAGENATCDDDCTLPSCGDGNLNTFNDEVCDDGNNTDGDGCDSNCTVSACGNGITAGGEQCDDENASNNDVCLSNCQIATCGDGFVCSGVGCTTGPSGGVEQCDDDDADDNDSCRNNCATATCGDGVICSSPGCTTGPSSGVEQCDNAGLNGNAPDACRANCANPSCGDNVTDGGETCDTGGNSMTCDSNCTGVSCGDGFINGAAGETCEQGAVDTMTCDANCTAATCGDGYINAVAGELCDDSNDDSGDGCSSTCQSGVGSGETDRDCPDLGELVLYAKNSSIPCVNDSECDPPRTCDESIGFCVTGADLDSGWTGNAHDSDINDEVRTRASLLCETGEPCGVCEVVGIDPEPRNCRCTNGGLNPAGVRTVCDEPFQADADDCGGQICDCYFGAPFPLNSAGTHVCVVNRFSEDVTGTANVDLGAGAITARLRTKVYLGIVGEQPCPVCAGKCSDDQSICFFDEDCGGLNTCVQDVAGDGTRDGLCSGGDHDGLSCDVTATNASFPAKVGGALPGGGGYSLDCQPGVGANVTGEGLEINLAQTTGTSTLTSQVDCNGPTAGTDLCPCLMCSKDATKTCQTNGDCVSQGGQCSGVTAPAPIGCNTNMDCASVTTGTCTVFGNTKCSQDFNKNCTSNADCQNRNIGTCNISTCTAIGAGNTPKPNGCAGLACTDLGNGEGECTTGPDDSFCDGLVRIDGTGMKTCSNNGDCSGIGSCTYVKRRECFLNPIVGQGSPDPEFPVATATFCVAPTGATSVNQVAGLPGPGRVVSQGGATTFCATDHNTPYTPGVGGCP